ncbi:MAG: MarR family transcriptional regulator [Clostridia bacterium]|nr:MarR family transcriptional regulator [Clostridia bacterium]
MKLEWMGQNREIVEALIHYCNIYAGVYRIEKMSFHGIAYSYSQIQVLEYLLENEERNDNMSAIAHRLGITRSNFTKIVTRLCNKGLVEKVRVPGSRRDLNVVVNDLGRELYEDYAKGVLKRHFEPMFRDLDMLSAEDRAHVRDALFHAMHPRNAENNTQEQ